MRTAAAALGLTLLFCLLLAAGAADAEGEARLARLRASCDGRRVLVSFDLMGAFDDRLVERIESGLPTGFTFQFNLVRDRRRWFDRRLDGSSLRVVAIHDAVAGEYEISYKLNGKLVESRMVQDLAELRRAMTHFEDIPVFEFDGPPPERRLQVRARAELGPRTWLSIIPTTATTEWTESKKFRVPGALP